MSAPKTKAARLCKNRTAIKNATYLKNNMNATYFIAASTRQASVKAGFHTEMQTTTTSPTLAPETQPHAKTGVTRVTGVTAPIHAGFSVTPADFDGVTGVTKRGYRPPDGCGRCAGVRRCDRILPGASNTTDIAGNLPDSEVFSRPESFGFGRDGLVRKAGRMAISMLLTSRPPVARSKAASGFQSRIGAETMTKVNTHTTPKAAHLGNTPATSTSIIARQQAIENALTTALYFIRLPSTESGLKAATGRACRAASMLKQACAELQIGGAA